jgi:5-hydroxyisourate hydrolase
MSLITTHVLDTSRGRPASRVPVALELRSGNAWRRFAKAHTDNEGRATMIGTAEGTRHGGPVGTSPGAAGGGAWPAGTYRLVFDTGAYLRANGAESFFPEVAVVFEARDADQDYHVPLLLSPFGYSTYRGT